MKNLIADLIEKVVDHEKTTEEMCLQLDALEIVVMTFYVRLDEQSKQDIRQHISQAFDNIHTENQAVTADFERLRHATFSLLDRDIT